MSFCPWWRWYLPFFDALSTADCSFDASLGPHDDVRGGHHIGTQGRWRWAVAWATIWAIVVAFCCDRIVEKEAHPPRSEFSAKTWEMNHCEYEGQLRHVWGRVTSAWCWAIADSLTFFRLFRLMSKHELKRLLVFYISIEQAIVLKLCSVEANSFGAAFNRKFNNFGSSRAKYVERHSGVAKKIEFVKIT